MNDQSAHEQRGPRPGRREEDRLKDAAINRLEHTKVILSRIAMIALAMLAVLATGSTVLLWIQHGRDADALVRAANATHAADRAAAKATRALGKATAALSQAQHATSAATAIQASRRSSCRDTNQRHSATLHALARIYRVSAHNATTPALREQLRTGQRETTTIINALVPHRNCKRFVSGR